MTLTKKNERSERRAADLNAAVAHHQQGRLKDAEAGYRRLLQAEPNDAAVIRLLGLVMMGRGEWIPAKTLFEQATRLRPESVEAHVGLGNALGALGKLPEAEVAFENALSLDPNHLEALNNLGNTLQAMRRFSDAASVLRRALAINPALAELHNNLGNALQAEKKWDEAIAAFREAIRLRPTFPEAHSNLGNMLKADNQLEQAVDCYRRALELNPRYVDALVNLGNALHAQGLPAEAVSSYHRAQEVQPTHGDAYFYEALVHLAQGNLERGFAAYEYRWKSILRQARRSFPQPLWLGDSDLKGRVILLHAEQGLGDTLQFVRYASLAAERGATVYLEVQAPLKKLLTGFPGVEAVIARGEALPPFDLHCPLLSLPHAFRTTLENVPAKESYVGAPMEQRATWRSRLSASRSPRVGLMWTGNPHHVNDRNRSVPIECLRPLVESKVATFYSLQKEFRSDEERQLAASWGIADLSRNIGNFDSTAGLVAELDLVISVDTSMAHLAAALGRPTWVLLPRSPDWRWLLQREDSPWYPTVRLFRQERAGDWTHPVSAMIRALAGVTAP